MKYNTNSNKLNLIEFHIVEHCNLNCKSCMHFSPLAGESFIKITDFKNDVKQMLKITKGNVDTINLLGGEPLLHPELLRILKITRQYFQNSEIRLVSNGLLVLSQKEEFWKALQKYGIHLSITEYPLNINYQRIKQLTQLYKIKYTFYAPNKENSQWYFPLDLTGSQDAQYSYDNCKAGNNCTNINICKGKLFMCPVASNLKYFNKYFKKDIPLENGDFLSINQINNIGQIHEYMSKPISVCKYCNINARTYNNKWEQSKRDIHEWT